MNAADINSNTMGQHQKAQQVWLLSSCRSILFKRLQQNFDVGFCPQNDPRDDLHFVRSVQGQPKATDNRAHHHFHLVHSEILPNAVSVACRERNVIIRVVAFHVFGLKSQWVKVVGSGSSCVSLLFPRR